MISPILDGCQTTPRGSRYGQRIGLGIDTHRSKARRVIRGSKCPRSPRRLRFPRRLRASGMEGAEGPIDRQGRRRASWRNGPRQTRTLLASACLTIHWVACAAAGDDLGAHRADRRVELTRASPCSDFRLLT